MVDRRPQDYAGGEPDGVSDNTAAIQAAIDAWQPGDQVVISGGTFRTSGPLFIPHAGLVLRGDAKIKALTGFATDTAILEITGAGVILDTDGLEFDQADVIEVGTSIRTVGAAGLQVLNLVSRGTQRAFLCIEDNTTDLLVAGCDHLGKGYGVIAPDRPGLARLRFSDCRFEHPGTGTAGDGIELNCRTFGASDVEVVGCTASGYIGEATAQGIGFGFSGVTDGRIVGCRAEACEGDGFHFERSAHRWLCADLVALDIGVYPHVGGNGSGLIAYDSDDITVVLMNARNCAYHGIALSGQGSSSQRSGCLIERCTVDTTRRDGIHLTAQRNFRIDRNHVRDPSHGNPGVYAGINVGQQGGTTLENEDGTGVGNVVVLSGATSPLGQVVVRSTSVNVTVDGVSGLEIRVTEDGLERVTELTERRVLEAA